MFGAGTSPMIEGTGRTVKAPSLIHFRAGKVDTPVVPALLGGASPPEVWAPGKSGLFPGVLRVRAHALKFWLSSRLPEGRSNRLQATSKL